MLLASFTYLIIPIYRFTLAKCLNTCLCTAQNQGVNIMRTFIRIHRLEIEHVANHAVLI